jgi:aminoglycoside phosphotransferase (APT) family kinase protein
VRKADITADLVARLVRTQFPQWAGLPVRAAVAAGGRDNVTFRLGEQMSVRLPSAQRYVPGVQKEQRWLPALAGQLPVDRATWTRGRGWAIWKAMNILVSALGDDPDDAAFTTRVIGKITADHLADI